MNKKHILLSIFWAISVFNLACFASDSDFDSLQILVKKSIESNQIKGSFIQKKKLKEVDMELQTTGRFEINRTSTSSALLLWQVQKPAKSEMCLDNEKVVIDQPQKQKFFFKEMSGNTFNQISLLKQVLSFDRVELKKQFKVTHQPMKNQWIFEPLQLTNALFTKIALTPDQKGGIGKIELTEKTMDALNIEFSDVQYSMSKKGIAECK